MHAAGKDDIAML